ncbi:MAG: hypothetical protein E6I91_21810 [Chloroflexi bacterium]|nr:MAG: hypothetical protein E6I91_21810 [Chloroflexota bacterium]
MATEIVLPQWSMGMADGTIVRWLKHEGDPVTEGEPLVEVEAAKVTSEVEAEVSGVLVRILVAEGETVPVRTALCLIGTADEVRASAEAPTEPVESATGASTPVPPVASSQPTVQVTPVARRMAKEHGINLSQVRGSGPGGRIVTEDVQRASLARSRAGHSIDRNARSHCPANASELADLGPGDTEHRGGYVCPGAVAGGIETAVCPDVHRLGRQSSRTCPQRASTFERLARGRTSPTRAGDSYWCSCRSG